VNLDRTGSPRHRVRLLLLGAIGVALGSAWMLLSPVSTTTAGGVHAQCNYDALSIVFAPPDTAANIGSECISASRVHVAVWGGVALVALAISLRLIQSSGVFARMRRPQPQGVRA